MHQIFTMINPLLTGTVTNLDKNLVYNTTMAISLNPKSFPAKVVAAAERTFPFLDLPVEMQVNVVNYIAQPSDLQALCLVSRKVSGIATPRLYHEVNLIPHGHSGLSLSGGEIQDSLRKIRALVRASYGLRCVRILRTTVSSFRIARLWTLCCPDSKKIIWLSSHSPQLTSSTSPHASKYTFSGASRRSYGTCNLTRAVLRI